MVSTKGINPHKSNRSYNSPIVAISVPAPLLTIVAEDLALDPSLTGLCAGFERGSWRHEPFAEYLMEWLIDFVFTDEEQQDLSPQSARRFLRKAAQQIYDTDKYGRRGEFGELLLHVILRQHFGSLPAVRKIYFKDSRNDTVKGFDAVHVVAGESDLELWLGEAKFYSDLPAAIRDIAQEITEHSETDYLRSEFSLVLNKVDRDFPHYDRLKLLLDPATSLDDVFDRLRIPALVTYDSAATMANQEISPAYRAAISSELRVAHAQFVGRSVPPEMVVHLIAVPLATKQLLVDTLHAKLVGLQT